MLNQNSQRSDTALIRLFEERNEDAIRETKARYGSFLEQFAARFLSDKRDREEAVSDAIWGLWKAIPPHKPRSLQAFLTALIRRACIRQLREQGRKKEVPREHLLALEELEEVLPDASDAENELLAKELGLLLEAFLKEEPRFFDTHNPQIGRCGLIFLSIFEIMYCVYSYIML